jgi:uncharacterized protein (DUF1330 family)
MPTLVALLWPHPGQEQALIDYEDTVLALLPTYGCRVIERVRRTDDSDGPFETQIIEYPDEDSVAAYMVDPARVALADIHSRAIERTVVVRVSVVEPVETTTL